LDPGLGGVRGVVWGALVVEALEGLHDERALAVVP